MASPEGSALHPVRITPVAVTAAERRVARDLDLGPGGEPTLKARAASWTIRLAMKSVWARSPHSSAGLLLVRRLTDLLARGELVPRGVRIAPEDFGGGAKAVGRGGTEWVRAGAPDERRAFLYLHGGGYFFGGPRLYRGFTWRLAAATAHPVLALDFRLAPEHTPADALEDALAAYDFLLERGHAAEDIVVGGDSAGGHLMLALLLALKERGTPQPAAGVCLSPWVDLLCSAESHRLNARSDALIPAAKLAWLGRTFCQDKEEYDPLFSPVRGDFKGLPPMMFLASGSEILRDDTRGVAERARAAGVPVVYQEWGGLVHVFPVFAQFVPEGRAAFRHIAEFLRAAAAAR